MAVTAAPVSSLNCTLVFPSNTVADHAGSWLFVTVCRKALGTIMAPPATGVANRVGSRASLTLTTPSAKRVCFGLAAGSSFPVGWGWLGALLPQLFQGCLFPGFTIKLLALLLHHFLLSDQFLGFLEGQVHPFVAIVTVFGLGCPQLAYPSAVRL